MKRYAGAVLILALAALPVRAHFIWIVPEKEGGKAKVIFSEDLNPDSNVPVNKIAKTELFLRADKGKSIPLKWSEGKDAYTITIPDKKMQVVGAVCRYGVLQRGKDEPFLLNYYAKSLVSHSFEKGSETYVTTPWSQLPLDIMVVLTDGEEPRLRVLWQGKPAAGVEVVLLLPGKEKPATCKTDKDGFFDLTETKTGLYGIRVGYTQAQEGELEGKKYKQVRHYTTFTFEPVICDNPTKGKTLGAKVADPAATKLLADARAARAQWTNFPGFRADLEVNLNGKVSKGKVEVSFKGKVTVTLDEEAAAKWARGILASTVSHRLDNSAALDTPCAFADSIAHHPLGRAIRVLNDEFHSSYRVRDRQIIVVNRQMKEVRFTITVMHNILTKDKKYLPSDFVVNTWDLKTDALRSSETHHQSWKRVDTFDLPGTTTVVTATAGQLEARSLKLSNHKLTPGVGAVP
jgi:uncharacterized GH25 family protein